MQQLLVSFSSFGGQIKEKPMLAENHSKM